MKTYDITPDLAGTSGRRKATRIVVLAVLWVAASIVLHFLWPSASSGPLLFNLIEAVITGIIWAWIMVAILNRILRYKLIVSDDSITAVYPWFVRSVQKNLVKTVLETDGNALVAPLVRISKHGRFGAFLLGWDLQIPKSLPEYKSIRDLALSWKRSVGA